MDQLPWRNRRKGIPPGSTSHGLEAWSPPFQLKQFPSTDTDPTALPPRPTRAADEIGAESWKELKAFSTYLKDIYPGLLSNPKSMPSNSPFREPEFSYKMKSLQDFTISFLNIRESLTFSFYHWDSLTCLIWKVHRGRFIRLGSILRGVSPGRRWIFRPNLFMNRPNVVLDLVLLAGREEASGPPFPAR